MRIVLFDDEKRANLLPLTYTRPAAELRTGILTNTETWQALGAEIVGHITVPHLQNKYELGTVDPDVYVNGRLIPSQELFDAIRQMKSGSVIRNENSIAACSCPNSNDFGALIRHSKTLTEYNIDSFEMLERCSDLFSKNDQLIRTDFQLITQGRKSAELDSSVTVIGDASQLFVEQGAKIMASTINTTTGPVYVGKEAEIMEGCLIRGPFALCSKAIAKMGAKIYGATTIGPECRVGGEVGNSVMLGYSNKGHDGYMGNSVLGEWCNLGADTNTSNLKNNYSIVKAWDYPSRTLQSSGLTFLGLIMGDHSKCAINTQFNTGTTVGCCANIFGSDFPPKFVPSFSWGGASGFVTFKLEKAYEVAERVMARRKVDFTDSDRKIMQYVFDDSSPLRD